jgi:hypothetical protein
VFATGYAAGQDADGRMCCTGTIATAITVRITNVGPSVSSYVTRSAGSPYTKQTSAFNCDQMNADYVLSLSRQNYGIGAYCSWGVEAGETCNTGDYRLMDLRPSTQDPSPPNNTAAFPNWWLTNGLFRFTLTGSRRTQTCTGFPGIESCNIGGNTGTLPWFVYPETIMGVLVSEQKCNPAGTVVASSISLWTNETCQPRTNYSNFNTGCLAKVELV